MNQTLASQIPDKPKLPEQPCANCNKRVGTQLWLGVGGALAYTHGMHTYWCKICVLETQLEHARERAALIPELEAELAQLKEKE